MPIKCPGLTRRDKSANFRLRVKVPVDLLAHYHPKKELTFSLGTSNREEACARGTAKRGQVLQEFQAIRAKRDAEVRTSLSEPEMDRLALLLQHSMLKADDQIRISGPEDWFFDRQGEEQAQRLETYRRALARGDMSVVAPVVEDWLWGHGIQLDRGSQDFKTLAHRFLKALVTATDKQAQRHQGGVVDTPPDPGSFQPQVRTAPEGELSLSGLFDKWKDEKKDLPATTSQDFWGYIRRFIELHGDLPLSMITKAHVRDYKDAMLKLPSIVHLEHKHRSLTVPALLDLAEKQPDLARLSPRTVNDKALGALGAVLSWGSANGYLESNPAAGVKVSMGKAPQKSRLPYTIEDLNLIFRFPVFTTEERPKGGAGEAAKWLPLLALFTGARLQELGRLQVEDVREEWGVLFFDLTTAGTKTKSAKRNVPVHPELIRLGFLGYLEGRRKAGGGPLFPDLKSRQDSPTESWSKWWGRYARGNGITDPRKVFHSFRHTVKDGFRNSRVAKEYRDLIQGHAIPGVGEEYGSGTGLQVLAEEMAKLRFPGLDLEHLVPASGGC